MKLDAIIKNLCDTINADPKATWAVKALAALGQPMPAPKYDAKRAQQRRRMGLEVDDPAVINTKNASFYSAAGQVKR